MHMQTDRQSSTSSTRGLLTVALDLQLRGGSGFYEGDARVYNTALALGLNWY
jgi:hypothetical protein